MGWKQFIQNFDGKPFNLLASAKHHTTVLAKLFALASVGLLFVSTFQNCSKAREPSMTQPVSLDSACTKTCHGNILNMAPPNGLYGAKDTSDIGVGVHQSHILNGRLRPGVSCNECHIVPSRVDDPKHIDEVPGAEVVFGPMAKLGGSNPTWNHEEATCSNVYCHGDSVKGGKKLVPVWTQPNDELMECDACHGYPPPAPHPQIENCNDCHANSIIKPGVLDLSQNIHIDGTLQMGGESCITCHQFPQGPRRAVVGLEGDFIKLSHHVTSGVKNSDCLVCHDLTLHKEGTVRLKDPDAGSSIIYTYNEDKLSDLENFCLNCHDPDGAQAGLGRKPFSSKIEVADIKGSSENPKWTLSAHKTAPSPMTCLGDGQSGGCHSSGHGSNTIKMLNPTPSIHALCFNCHTNGKVENFALSGPDHASSIAESFTHTANHDLGAYFWLGEDPEQRYEMECTTCHNPHLVSGSHLESGQGKSPVTRPKFSELISENPRAVGDELWGDDPDEKTSVLAESGYGTGGWEFNILRGFEIGAMDMPFDQGAVYLAPLADTETGREVAGTDAPDYTTMCLDCHTNYVNKDLYPINWGQDGFLCDPSGPEDERINCRATHGLDSANSPRMGQWVLLEPFNSDDRMAGVNYVLSCLDCHESHGSNIGQMIRSKINNVVSENDPSELRWGTICAKCHYTRAHYGGGCATGSCHGNIISIHRNFTTNSVDICLRPPEPRVLEKVEGEVGSDQLTLTFSVATYSFLQNGKGPLYYPDIKIRDADNHRTVLGVVHTPGDTTATVTLSSPLDEVDDLNVDSLFFYYDRVYDACRAPLTNTEAVITPRNGGQQ
jgi:predicted CxxxxCH...CXXCH cytochrome family protein